MACGVMAGDPFDASEAASRVLKTPDASGKSAAALMVYGDLLTNSDNVNIHGQYEPPDRPARPARPSLAAPGQMPRRRLSSEKGRIALLHAVAHIEFNAIDLAFDMAARFTGEIAEAGLDPHQFVSDWFKIGADEARHFNLVSNRLNELATKYGDLPAHDGLWESALATNDSALARLAIAPIVLEARGLDVTPQMIENLLKNGDDRSAEVLKVIYHDEIAHVATGVHWFKSLCKVRNLAPIETFQSLVRDRFAGGLKPPFNEEARTAAGVPHEFYA